MSMVCLPRAETWRADRVAGKGKRTNYSRARVTATNSSTDKKKTYGFCPERHHHHHQTAYDLACQSLALLKACRSQSQVHPIDPLGGLTEAFPLTPFEIKQTLTTTTT